MDETLRLWGEAIRLRREFLRLSQAEVAAHMDPPVTQPTVARWERGLMEPRRHYKAQLAALLQTDARMLFPMVAA